jgi:hypothetical protein
MAVRAVFIVRTMPETQYAVTMTSLGTYAMRSTRWTIGLGFRELISRPQNRRPALRSVNFRLCYVYLVPLLMA